MLDGARWRFTTDDARDADSALRGRAAPRSSGPNSFRIRHRSAALPFGRSFPVAIATRGSRRCATTSTQSSKRAPQRQVGALEPRPSPRASSRCRSPGATARRPVKSHWIVPGRAGAARCRPRARIRSNSISHRLAGRAAAGRSSRRARRAGAARMPRSRALARRQVGREERRARAGPRSACPALRSLVSSEVAPSLADVLDREAEHLRVAASQSGGTSTAAVYGITSRSRSATAPGTSRVLAVEVGEQLHAEADVALLVLRDVLHPSRKPGQQVALVQVARR